MIAGLAREGYCIVLVLHDLDDVQRHALDLPDRVAEAVAADAAAKKKLAGDAARAAAMNRAVS